MFSWSQQKKSIDVFHYHVFFLGGNNTKDFSFVYNLYMCLGILCVLFIGDLNIITCVVVSNSKVQFPHKSLFWKFGLCKHA
jgi:hypothetical protein